MGYGKFKITGELIKQAFAFPDDSEFDDVVVVVSHKDIPEGRLVECDPHFTKTNEDTVDFVGWNPKC